MNHIRYHSPIGLLTLVEETNALIAVSFDTEEPADIGQACETPVLKEAAKQLDEYFSSSRTVFTLPLRMQGTEFQNSVWNALQTIPYGKTLTYGDIAKQIKRANAQRAVGNANNKNPIPIIVPCHRVIGASGNLVGYGGGLDKKQYLLDLEQSNRKSE